MHALNRITSRLQGTRSNWRLLRGWGVGPACAAWHALRYAATGRSGRVRLPARDAGAATMTQPQRNLNANLNRVRNLNDSAAVQVQGPSEAHRRG